MKLNIERLRELLVDDVAEDARPHADALYREIVDALNRDPEIEIEIENRDPLITTSSQCRNVFLKRMTDE